MKLLVYQSAMDGTSGGPPLILADDTPTRDARTCNRGLRISNGVYAWRVCASWINLLCSSSRAEGGCKKAPTYKQVTPRVSAKIVLCCRVLLYICKRWMMDIWYGYVAMWDSMSKTSSIWRIYTSKYLTSKSSTISPRDGICDVQFWIKFQSASDLNFAWAWEKCYQAAQLPPVDIKSAQLHHWLPEIGICRFQQKGRLRSHSIYTSTVHLDTEWGHNSTSSSGNSSVGAEHLVYQFSFTALYRETDYHTILSCKWNFGVNILCLNYHLSRSI